MTSTSTVLGPDFVKSIFPWILDTIDKGTREAYHMLWGFFMEFLNHNWLPILIILVLVLLVAIVRAVSGYWGMLGSVLYNYLYFGILFIVGLIKGPEVFVNEYFEIVTLLILYPVCYFMVGGIIDKFGFRRRY